MSLSESPAPAVEIARLLGQALERACLLEASQAAVIVARDAARVLGLPGLERALMTWLPHAGRACPQELLPVLDRMRSLAHDCRSTGDPAILTRADRELEALTAPLGVIDLDGPRDELGSERSTTLTLSLADVVEDLPLAGDESRELGRRVRLTAQVGGAVRAAMVWLAREKSETPAVRGVVENSMLEILCERVNYSGLRAASRVLAAAGGNLGPATGAGWSPHPEGTWVVRVPTHGPENEYLMFTQGELRLAVPWNAVLRLAMVRAAEIQTHIRGLGLPVLDPLAPLSRPAAEYPVVLVASGLKRAYLVADRLIWRLAAEPYEVQVPAPMTGLGRAVRAQDGEIYWVAEPQWLLGRVETPGLAELVSEGAAVESQLAARESAVEGSSAESAPSPPPALGWVGESAPGGGASAPPAVGPAAESAPSAPAGLRPHSPQATLESVSGLPPRDTPVLTAIGSRSPGRGLQWVLGAERVAPPAQPGPETPAGAGAHGSEQPTGIPARAGEVIEAAAPFEGPRAPEAAPPTEPRAAEPASMAPGAAELGPGPAAKTSIPTLSPADVEPLPSPAGTAAAPLPEQSMPVDAPAPRPERAAPAAARRRALLAEDSITGRVFLTRLLEQRGFSVRAVPTASELFAALPAGSWSLVCVDVELPDGRGVVLLRGLMERLSGDPVAPAVVALVRDELDLAESIAGGVGHTLSKPFERQALERLLGRLGLAHEP